jgi:Acetyltransferase (GNAT) domain
VVLRDLPDGDEELHDFLTGEGLLRIPVLDSWVRDIDFSTDEEFLAGLSSRHRYHQRTRVLPWEAAFRVEVLAGGSPEAEALPVDLRDTLHAMYRAVHGRALELNVFPLPRRLLDAVLGLPGWETVLLHLPDEPDRPVGFIVSHVAATHVTPVFVGLDYAYVPTHNSYQQLLFQALRSARRHGARRVYFGMGADLHKARFGARRVKRWAYVQPTETYNADVLAHLAETAAAG